MQQIDNIFRVKIKPFDTDGNYLADFIDVTRFLERAARISEDTDSSEFSVGVFRTSNLQVALNNHDGLFSDVDVEQSIFDFSRSNSLVRITYALSAGGLKCGQFKAGEAKLSEEVRVYEGLLDDDALKLSASDETVKFRILGKESILSKVKISDGEDSTGFSFNFNDLSGSDLISDIVFKFLSHPQVTELLNVDVGNISIDIDQIPDSLEPFRNQTLREALQDILELGNSVLYLKDDDIFVTERAPTDDVQFTFFGQASNQGAENVDNIINISSGKHRTFNFATWKDNAAARFTINDSVKIHGARKRELDFEHFTDTVKQVNIQEALVTEFGFPKQEFDLISKATYKTLALKLLDKVKVDYPTVFVPQEFELPICGLAICGEAVLPRGLWAFSVPQDREYKIIKKQIDPRAINVTFKLREI